MDENNKLDFDKEIADMEALIGVLTNLKAVTERLKNQYWNKAVHLYERQVQDFIDPIVDEFYEKSHLKAIEVFQLEAEIKQKHIVLAELKSRAKEDNIKTEILAKQADMSLDDRIAQAKKLSDDLRVPIDIRNTLKSRFIEPYRKTYKFKFKDEGQKAGFYQALILLIEKAQNWTINTKK